MSKHWSKLNRPTMSNLTLLESCNPSFHLFGHDNFMTSTWIEGGEWPSYRDTYSNYTLASPTRHVLKPSPLAAETTSELITYVLNMDFTTNTSCSLQVPYGVSTGAICVDIAFNLCRTRQFIVTLSTAVAIEVARNAKCTAITSIETCVSKSPPDGIYSVSSGLFMHIMLSNMLHKSDMIILNSPNNMVVASSIVSHLLDKSQWHTIVITPNNMDTLPLRGTTRNALECAPEKDSHNLLGPSSVTSMNLNPNEYVGTISLPETPMRDARVRLDPIMQVDKLVYNTRKLLYEDVINLQLVVPNTRDRLREKSNHNNKISQCKLYYDILHLIIMMALGLHKGDITLARSLWRRNGFPTSSDAAALPLSLAPYRVRDKSDIRIGYDHSVAGDWLLARFKYPHNPDLYGKVQDSISSAASTQVKSVNGKFTIVLTVTQIRDYNADSYTSIVNTRALRIQPDQYGRVCYEECKMTRKPLSSILLLRAIWNEYRKMVKYRDTIYVDTIPFVDDRQIDFMSKEDARQVLACKLLPTYSEQEANSVLALWNEYAKRYKRIPISDLRYVNTFVNYFVDRERR